MASSHRPDDPSDSTNGATHNGGRGCPVSLGVRQEILRQVARGRKLVDIAKDFGVHPNSISRWKALAKAAESTSPESALSPTRSSSAPPTPLTPAPSPPPAPTRTEESSTTSPRETGRYSADFKRDVLAQVDSGRKIVEVARQYGLPEGTVSR